MSFERQDAPPALLQSQELLKFLLCENRHAKFFSLVVFRSWIGAHHNVIRLLAHQARNFPAVLLHDLTRFLTRPIRQAAREDKTLPRKFVALDLALFRRGMHA